MPFLQMSNESPSKAPWHLLIGASLAMLMLIAISIGAPRPASAETGKAGDGCAACVLTAESSGEKSRKGDKAGKPPARKVKRATAKLTSAQLVAKRREKVARIREARRAREQEFRRDWNNLVPKSE